CAPIRERRESVDVAFNRLRLAEDGVADRMRNQMMVQTLSQRCAGRQVENTAVVNDTSADIAAAQRNYPRPPAVTHEMIGGPLPASAARVRHFREFFAPFITVPFFTPFKSPHNRLIRCLRFGRKLPSLRVILVSASDGVRGGESARESASCNNCSLRWWIRLLFD